MIHVCWIPLYIKNLKSISDDTESENMYFIGSNKYIITKIECWPASKQDPISASGCVLTIYKFSLGYLYVH